jgi:hypothetical protein
MFSARRAERVSLDTAWHHAGELGGPKSDTPAKGGGLVNVTASKAVGLNQVDL